MSKESEALKSAAGWSVLREYKPVVERFSNVAEADLTEPVSQKELEVLFSHYFARLGSEAARFDRPEARLYMQLAPICAPDVFLGQERKTVENKLSLLGKPGTDSRDLLYPLAREVQHLALGSVYLRNATPLFKSDEIPPGLTPVVIEHTFESKFLPNLITARIPLVLTGNPGTDRFMNTNMRFVEKVVQGLGRIDADITVDVNHLPATYSKAKDIVRYRGTHPVLDWAFANQGGRIDSHLVASFLNNPALDFEHSLIESVAISSVEFSKKWQAAQKDRLFGSYTFDHNTWKYWSFNNTVYQIKNVAVANMLRVAAKLAYDVVSIPNIQFDSARNAALAVHVPILLGATAMQIISKGVEQGLRLRQEAEEDRDRKRSEAESRSWF